MFMHIILLFPLVPWLSLSNIFQLTHSQENVLDLQWLESSEVNQDELEAVARNMAMHLRHLLDQRDTHLEVLMFVFHHWL